MKILIIIKNTKFYPHKKRKKRKINNILFEKKDMLKNPDFEQDHL